MPDTPVPLAAEIGVGALVKLRTELEIRRCWVVVAVGRWWPWKGKLKIVCQPGGAGRFRFVAWVYPAEVERVPDTPDTPDTPGDARRVPPTGGSGTAPPRTRGS